MANLNYSITIKATKEKVWHIMLDLDTYKMWTNPFYPGSYFEGSWDKGSHIKFLAEAEGKVSGIYGRITENKPYEYVSIEYLGEVINGEIDTEGAEARRWIGAHENYRFKEENGTTTVQVELTGENMAKEAAEMFDGMWPKALEALKALAENPYN